MASITDIVDKIIPAADAVSVVLGTEISVIFDREIDINSVNDGNFFVEGPDTDSVIGPDLGMNLPNNTQSSSDDQFESPNFRGIVQGTYRFERINLDDDDKYSGFDYSGTGTSWRTKAIFIPSMPLSTNTSYRVYLVGDEDPDDNLSTGIRTKSVFDTVKGMNIGDADATFVGSYSGPAEEDKYTITCSVGGEAGIAKFTWFKDSDPLNTRGPLVTSKFKDTFLENGISIEWDDNKTYIVDDTYSVVVKQPETFSGNTFWDFTTGSGSLLKLPDDVSTSVLGSSTSATVSTAEFLQLVSTTPDDMALEVPTTTKRITLEFDKIIDSGTVNPETVTTWAFAANHDECLLADQCIFKDITVSGNLIILDI